MKYLQQRYKLLLYRLERPGIGVSSRSERGFTLVELIVVVAIMAVVAGMVIVSFNNVRGPRDLKIAQGQMITAIRKIQSYSLSSKNLPGGGKPASYYIVRLDTATPGSYKLQATDNQSPKNFNPNIETLNLPQGIRLQTIALSDDSIPACLQILFALPYGKVYMDKDCKVQDNLSGLETYLATTTKNLIAILTLQSLTDSATKTVTVNGIIGVISGN